MIKNLAVLAAFALAAVPASADEAWKTRVGKIVWTSDIGSDAVLSVDLGGGKSTFFYVNGLTAKMDGGRSRFEGYWVSNKDDKICDSALTAPDGVNSRTWGRLEMIFVKPGFPSDWTMKTGDCFGEMSETITGIAQVGR